MSAYCVSCTSLNIMPGYFISQLHFQNIGIKNTFSKEMKSGHCKGRDWDSYNYTSFGEQKTNHHNNNPKKRTANDFTLGKVYDK